MSSDRGEDGSKEQTFSRAFTFQDFRLNTFSRTITRGFGLSSDEDDRWAEDMIRDYLRAPEKGVVDGDVPLPGGFAKEFRCAGWTTAY